MKRVLLAAAAVWLGGGLRVFAQNPTQTPSPAPTPTPTPGTPSTVPAGVKFATQDSANINGVKVEVAADGSVWFLEASVDRVGVLRGTTITYWQLRPSDDLGVNPVNFKLDGTIVWILGTGQSQIPAGRCTISRLDTVSNEVTEYVVPGSIPASFYAAPDGTYWVPISGAALLNVNVEAGTTDIYRSAATYAYADMVVAPDGALWLADFGNNRIVRYVPGATTETSWTMLSPSFGRLNPAEIRFDDHGLLWISQLSGGRMDRFDPVTGNLDSFPGITSPYHFDFFQGRVYVTSRQNSGAVNIVDPGLVPPTRQTLTPQTLDVHSTPSQLGVTSRTFSVPPTTFETAPETLVQADFVVANNPAFPGILVNQIPVTQSNGIAVVGGKVWFGASGALVRVDMQTIGAATDRSAPAANSVGGTADDRIRVDLTLSNPGTAAITGEALYLYSPAAFAARANFTLAPGTTQVINDAFGNIGVRAAGLVTGGVRFHVLTGNAADLQASVHTTRTLPSGAAYGYKLGTQTIPQALGPGSNAILFTGARSTEASVLGMYTMAGAAGTLTLVAPDGTVRGTHPFDLGINTREDFNPVAAAFGVAPQPGDIVRISVAAGAIQPYVNVLDLGTFDVAAFVPVSPLADAIVPNAGVLVGINGTEFITDLFLSNPDASTTASVAVTYYSLYGGSPVVETVTLPPGHTQVVENVLLELYGLQSGQGSLFVSSNVPVSVGTRVGSRTAGADYAGFAPAINGAAGLSAASASSFGFPQTPTRRTNLLFYNRGAAGSVTVSGRRADGTPAGQVQVALGDHAPGRLEQVFAALGVTNQPGGRVELTVPAGMNVYAWSAEVDNATGDVDLTAVP